MDHNTSASTNRPPNAQSTNTWTIDIRPTDEAIEECRSRPETDPTFIGPYFSKQRITFTHSCLAFDAKDPKDSFGLEAAIFIPVNNTHDLIVSLKSVFRTDHRIIDKVNNDTASYYGTGNITRGNEHWLNVPAEYYEWDFGLGYGIRIGR